MQSASKSVLYNAVGLIALRQLIVEEKLIFLRWIT